MLYNTIMYQDTELERLEDNRDHNITEQTKVLREIEKARDRLEDELDRVKRDWGGKLRRHEEDLTRLHEQLPQLTVRINARKNQIEREQGDKK